MKNTILSCLIHVMICSDRLLVALSVFMVFDKVNPKCLIQTVLKKKQTNQMMCSITHRTKLPGIPEAS